MPLRLRRWPVNPVGIVLLVLGVILIVGEFFTGSGLLLGFGIAFIIGGIIFLVFGQSPFFQVNWWLVVLISVIAVGVLAFVVVRVRSSYHKQVTTGIEDLKGKTAIVKKSLDPEGTVFYQGELWNAVSESGKVEAGEEVIITRVDRLKLSVTRKEPYKS
jgi:membrane-bound serine protease (ClpP class)